MPIEIRPVSDLRDGVYPYSDLVRPMVARMMNAMGFEFANTDLWGRYYAQGSCRAVAYDPAYPGFLFGVSVFGASHAEENLVPQIQANGGQFTYMYVDIEPCHDGRYPGHACERLIRHTFNSGTVFFGMSQEDYTKGDVKRVRAPGPQEQADANASATGHFPFPLIPLGRGRGP